MKIRPAHSSDLPTLVEIYNFYVLNHIATFDSAIVNVQDRQQWLASFAETGLYRIFVAENEHQEILGWASSNKYRDHPAFIKTVEFSIYLSHTQQGKGVGSALYENLFAALKKEDVHVVLAGVAQPNPASLALHRKFGFREIGIFSEYALKNGKYISSMWFEKIITSQ